MKMSTSIELRKFQVLVRLILVAIVEDSIFRGPAIVCSLTSDSGNLKTFVFRLQSMKLKILVNLQFFVLLQICICKCKFLSLKVSSNFHFLKCVQGLMGIKANYKGLVITDMQAFSFNKVPMISKCNVPKCTNSHYKYLLKNDLFIQRWRHYFPYIGHTRLTCPLGS